MKKKSEIITKSDPNSRNSSKSKILLTSNNKNKVKSDISIEDKLNVAK